MIGSTHSRRATTSTQRATTSTQRATAGTRREARSRPHDPEGYLGAVAGTNALQVGYADVDQLGSAAGGLDQPGLNPGVAGPEEAGGARVRRSPPARPRQRTRHPGVAARPAPVAPPAPVALPRAPFLILVLVLVVAGVLGVLVLNTKINESSFRLDDLKAQQGALDLQEQQLERDLAEAQSPGNLRAAANRLGLVPAGAPAFITLPDGRVVGVPTPATGPPGSAVVGSGSAGR